MVSPGLTQDTDFCNEGVVVRVGWEGGEGRKRGGAGGVGWGWGVGAFRALTRVSVLLVQFSSVQFSSRWCLCARTRIYLPVGYDLCEAQIRLSSRPYRV